MPAKRVSSFGITVLVAVLLCGAQPRPCLSGEIPQDPPQGAIVQKAESTSVTPPTVLPSYRINPGDTLEISVFDKPELSKQLIVPPDGKIQYAFVEGFIVAQLTLKEVKDRLTASLSKQLNNPQVSVSLVKRQVYEVSVLGAVKTPGKRVLGDNWRVLDLIADSGGLIIARPEWVTAKLVRAGGDTVPIDMAKLMSSGIPEHNPVLSAGDILLISEVDQKNFTMQVLGEVAKPGAILVPEDGSFATIITAVGGFNARASRAKVTLIRAGKAITVDMREALTTGKVLDSKGGEIKAQAGDTLIVAENKLTYAVLGAVNRPGIMEFPETGEVTILSALSVAGGPQLGAADLKNAVLVRLVPGGQPQGTALNLEDLLNKQNLLKNQTASNNKSNNKNKPNDGKGTTIDEVLKPGDYIYVPLKSQGRPNTASEVFRNALTVLPFFSLLQ